MTSAIIVAAGKGTRMGPGSDKLFLEVAGRPVIAHAWERFDQNSAIDDIVLVVRPEMESLVANIGARYRMKKPFRIVPGGKERQDSVWNGLEALSSRTEIVAIHDAARPCTPPAAIEATLRAARESGAAVTAAPVTDTIKISEDGVFIQSHPDRSRLWAVQTPQCFQVEIIRRALQAVRDKGLVVTDDTAACEMIGQKVRLVPNDQPNPKVTVPADLAYIGLLLKAEA